MKETGNINDFFGLPEDYFDASKKRLLEKLELQNELKSFLVLGTIKKENPFSLPQNYFAETEIKTLYPEIYKAGRENQFGVPANYFDKSKEKLLSEIHSGKTKIISLFFKTAPWAAAAAILILFALNYKKSNPINEIQDDCHTLACIEKRELLKKLENTDVEDLFELVNPESLEKALNTNKDKTSDNSNTNDSLLDDLGDFIE